MPTPSLPRRLAPLAAAAVVAVALAACGSSGSPSANQGSAHAGSASTTTSTGHGTTTTVAGATSTTAPPRDQAFSPFTADGNVAQGLQVTQQVSGTCSGPGVAGSSSYRCTAEPGNAHYDPCFAAPSATTGALLCVPDPLDTDLIRFSTGKLPALSPSVPATAVWAMRLENGDVCVRVNAQWHGLGPFACPALTASGSVADCRAPTKSGQQWSTQCQTKEAASSPFTAIRVVNVWT